jgi:hypothetical protein
MLRLKEYCVDTSSSSALVVWEMIVGDCLVHLHVLPHQLTGTTADIFSYIICQSCWKMYPWQSEHECGTCKIVLCRTVRDVLKNTYYDRRESRGGISAWPPHSPDFNHLDFYLWEHLKTLVYAAPVNSEQSLNHHIVDASHTIRSYPGISDRMQRSIQRKRLNDRRIYD